MGSLPRIAAWGDSVADANHIGSMSSSAGTRTLQQCRSGRYPGHFLLPGGQGQVPSRRRISTLFSQR